MLLQLRADRLYAVGGVAVAGGVVEEVESEDGEVVFSGGFVRRAYHFHAALEVALLYARYAESAQRVRGEDVVDVVAVAEFHSEYALPDAGRPMYGQKLAREAFRLGLRPGSDLREEPLARAGEVGPQQVRVFFQLVAEVEGVHCAGSRGSMVDA